ncbi:two-component regulator propeller domain-containing protein [Pontibacter sp. 13R65]|uniref:hybrid sensor histidine kinase/response regulator transcription factor n=1 Tax=Pontibacter sp. 13R65 TaxID=3127458 RepID=UPI00301E1508
MHQSFTNQVRVQVRFLWALCIAFCLLPGCLQAQNQPRFDKINDSKDLPSSSVSNITQDQDGFIWIGTKSGLSRYDGSTFKLYTQANGRLGADDVTTVFTDSKGRIWAGTLDGLQLLNKRSESFISFRYQPGNRKSISSNEINTIYEDAAGQIWIGTEHGLNRFIEQDSSFESYLADATVATSLSHNSVKTIYEDTQENLWVGTFGGGLNLFDTKSREFVSYALKNVAGKELKAKYIYVMRPFGQNQVLLGTSGEGLLLFDCQSGLIKPFFEQDKELASIAVIRALFEEPDGTLWIGTDGSGLLKVRNAGTGKAQVEQFVKSNTIQHSLSSNAIHAVFADKQRNIWIGTVWNGINILRRKDEAVDFFYSDFTGTDISPVLSVSKDRERLWFGTDGFGLNVLQLATATVQKLPGRQVGGDYVHLIKERKAGGYFIGTFSDGLSIYSPEEGKLQQFRHETHNSASLSYNDVRSVVEEENGNFWVASWGGGLSYFDQATGKFTNYRREPRKPNTISSDNVISLAEDGKGNLWVGTFGGGLNYFDTSSRKFYGLKAASEAEIPLATLNIISLLKDSLGYLWIGTWGQGLLRLDTHTKQVVRFKKLDGLHEKVVTALVEDEAGNIWLSTKSGIYQYEHQTKRLRKFNQLNGSYHINAVYKADGILYFGGNDGVVSFDPKRISPQEKAPQVKFTGLRLFNKEVKAGDETEILDKPILEENFIQLRHNHSLVTFEFAALGFPFADYEYTIKLENFDTDWREIGRQHEATFTNLSPGSYTLKVKARVPGGKWSKEYQQMQVVVQNPFWKTWWAYLLYGLVFGFLLYLFNRYTIHLEKLKSRLDLERLNREKEQELHNLKLQFFTDVSHEIRTPVTLMMGSINRIAAVNEAVPKQQVVQELRKNSSHLLQLVNELLDFSKIDASGIKLRASESDFVSFVKEIFLSFSTHAENRHIHYHFFCTQESISLWFDKEQMEKVVYNLLSNAFKFTDAGGAIRVEVAAHEYHVVLEVSDTGKGISETKLNKIFQRFYQSSNNTQIEEDGFGIGLSIVKKIVKLHAGKVFVESEPGKGSRFTVRLQQGNRHLPAVHQVEEAEIHENLAHYLVPATGEQQLQGESLNEASVLVAEDNADIRRYLIGLLQPMFRVYEAANGAEAFEQAVSHMPDLIISDIMMPVKDGITLTRELKKDVRTSHIPVILLTARTSFIYKKEGYETGADDYLTKPFSEVLLKTRIINLLKTRQLLREKFQLEMLTQPKNTALTSPDQIFLSNLSSVLDQHLDNDNLCAEFISKEMGISHSVVYKKVKALTGLSLVEFIRDFKLKRSAQLLKEHHLSVTDVCYKVGFSDRRYFSQQFRKKYGVPPSAYGNNLEVQQHTEENKQI